MLDLGTLKITIKADADKAKAKIKGVGDDLDELEGKSKGVSKLGGAFSTFAGTLGALGIGSIVSSIGDAIGEMAGEAVNSLDALTKFEQTMSFAGYDSSTIEQAKNDMKDYADRTVYDLGEVANTTAQLAANGIPNFEELTEAAGNLNAAAGGNADTFGSVAQMLTQTAGAGKLTTENWNQLTDAVPGASNVLQDALLEAGAYTGNFREAMEKGEITAEEFNAAIMQVGNQPIAVEAAQSVQTFEGAMGQLRATVVDGLMQIIDTIGMANITGFITGISGAISAAIPYITQFIGMLTGAGPSIEAFSASIANLVDGFLTQLPTYIQGITTFITNAFAMLGTSLQMLLPQIMMALGALIAQLVAAIPLWIPSIVQAAIGLFQGLIDGLTQTLPLILAQLPVFISNVCTALISMLPMLIQGAIQLFRGLIDGLIQTIPSVISALTSGIQSVASMLPSLIPVILSAAVELFTALVQSIPEVLPSLMDAVNSAIQSVGSMLPTLIPMIMSAAVQLFMGIVRAVPQILGALLSAVGSLIGQLPGHIASFAGSLVSAGYNLLMGFVEGIKSAAGAVISAVSGVVNDAIGAAKSLLGINSPSRLFRDFGGFTMEGFEIGITSNVGDVVKTMKRASEEAISAWSIPQERMAMSYQSYMDTKRNRSVPHEQKPSQNQTITVNNYSPKTLTEKETAWQFKQTMRKMTLSY